MLLFFNVYPLAKYVHLDLTFWTWKIMGVFQSLHASSPQFTSFMMTLKLLARGEPDQWDVYWSIYWLPWRQSIWFNINLIIKVQGGLNSSFVLCPTGRALKLLKSHNSKHFNRWPGSESVLVGVAHHRTRRRRAKTFISCSISSPVAPFPT